MPLSRRVLVIEEERHIARLVQVNLERQGYTITVACTARKAISSLERSLPNLIVLSLDLPDGGAYRVLEWLYHDREGKNVPVVLLANNPHDAATFSGWGGSGTPVCLKRPLKPCLVNEWIDRLLGSGDLASAGHGQRWEEAC